MSTSSKLLNKTSIKRLWLAALVVQPLLLVFPPNKLLGASFSCDREWERSAGDGRACEAERMEEESRALKAKACSKKECIYRLSFLRKQGRVQYYSGSGFIFVDERNKNGLDPSDIAQTAVVRSRLIDSNGGVTIVETSGAASSGEYDYGYVSGPLKEVWLGRHGNFYILHIPK